MEKSPVESHNNNPSYWTSVAIASLLFGIIVFVISLISSYITINSEPSGSYLSPSSFIGIFGCLISAFGGMLAIWHYAKENDVVIKLGRGALIGFLTGVGIVFVSIILNHLWQLIDPDMSQKFIDSTVANLRTMDLPGDKKQQIINSTVQTMKKNQTIGRQFLWGIPMYGIVNLITGMIGAKIFSKKEEETF